MIRSIVRNGIFILCGLVWTTFSSHSQGMQAEEHIEVSLRTIGHRVLLKAGDSTSRVLPIVHEDDQYKISFDTEFSFVPEDLVNTVNEAMKESKISVGYLLRVQECDSQKIIYSYEIGNINSAEDIPCMERAQPKGCYNLLIMLTGNKNAPSESKGVNYMFLVFPLIILLVVFLVLRRPKKPKNPHLIELGQYLFDKHKAELVLQEQRIELTGKEADLLVLLYDHVNETVEKETILNKVWGDEGDYIGRTLDVFISKLRKKLEADPNIKIMNIRGVGYKLVVDVPLH